MTKTINKRDEAPEVKTKKNEVIIKSLNPRELLNQFLTHNLCRKWSEDFVDEFTHETVSIARTEIILQKGTCLNPDNMQKVMFHLQCGDIKEPIEVSNQSRQANEVEYSRWPYMCKVTVGELNVKFILEARGVRQVLDIVTDWCELNYQGVFGITEVKSYDNAVILVDKLRQYPMDEAAQRYKDGEIPFEEFVDEVIDDLEFKKPENESDNTQLKFYQIKAAVAKDGERLPVTSLFVVLAADADRAILTINAYLQQKQKARNEKMMLENHPEDVDQHTISATIEESKIVNFSRLIPDSFCKAYYSEEE